ncbi:MAG TPA: 6,7-dimethyl-8-ribityllumazine synthase, partial [Methylophilaceae bacterium]|nr:6,7-dimethyl-8-ribityllumazine synthase [Methylophilaceae bacterium]
NTIKGDVKTFDAKGWKIGIVTAQFNSHITGVLQKSAIERAYEYGIGVPAIDTVAVAGVVEIPLVLQQMAQSKKYDVLLAIGCVIKGDTPHFDYVCKFVTEGILRVQLDESIPIALGVLTCNTEEQAEERKHLGGDHLDAVMQQKQAMLSL